MRPRDARAILFWIASTIAVVILLQALAHNWILTGMAAAVYNAWMLSRPRMVRVFRRLRGERFERSDGYFID